MTDLTFKERMIISTVLTFIAFVICYFCKSNLWVSFGIGSFGFQFVDHAIWYLTHKK